MIRLALASALGSVAVVVPSTVSAVAPAPAYTVGIVAKAAVVELPGKVKINGTVTPAAPGKAVTLQVRSPGKPWKTIASPRISDTGTWTWSSVPAVGKTWTFRATKPAGGGRAGGTSEQVLVEAYRWRDLVDLPVAYTDPGRGASVGAVTVDGVRHPRALRLPSSTSRTFVTESVCDRLETTAAVVDGSDAMPVDAYVVGHRALTARPGDATTLLRQTVDVDDAPLAIGIGDADDGDDGDGDDGEPAFGRGLTLGADTGDDAGDDTGPTLAFLAPRVHCRS